MHDEHADTDVPRHRPKREGRKPWAVEIRDREPVAGRWWFPDWTVLRRFRKQADAERSRDTLARKDARLWDVRVSGPEGA